MAWSETMLIIQHFYNVFDINERLGNVELKAPLVAKKENDLPVGVDVSELTPGTLWFIESADTPSKMEGLSVLREDNTFSEPIPFNVDLKDMIIDEEMQSLLSRMGLTAENYYDIIKIVLETISCIPVKNGGTGLTSITRGKMLVGTNDNKFKEIGFDVAPTENSENLLTSGAMFEQGKKYAPKVHSAKTTIYGVGTDEDYGHVKITDDYTDLTGDPTHTALSLRGVENLVKNIKSSLNIFQVISVSDVAQTQILMSSVISAYQPQDKIDTLVLLNDYFIVEQSIAGGYQLRVK